MTEAAAKRVVLADDSVLLREGIAVLLQDRGSPSWDSPDRGGSAAEGSVVQARHRDRRHPHAADLLDEGLRAAQEIREKHPGTAVLVLSQHVEAGYALELLAESAEGVGYLLKDRVSDVKDFVDACGA